VPLPFSRGIIRVGAPIEVPRETDESELEAVRQKLEVDLINLTMALDSELGVAPVEPAPNAADLATKGAAE
jgi:hypothetical protein